RGAVQPGRRLAPLGEHGLEHAFGDLDRPRQVEVALDQSLGELATGCVGAADIDQQVGDAGERAHHHHRVPVHPLGDQAGRGPEAPGLAYRRAAELHHDHLDIVLRGLPVWEPGLWRDPRRASTGLPGHYTRTRAWPHPAAARYTVWVPAVSGAFPPFRHPPSPEPIDVLFSWNGSRV